MILFFMPSRSPPRVNLQEEERMSMSTFPRKILNAVGLHALCHPQRGLGPEARTRKGAARCCQILFFTKKFVEIVALTLPPKGAQPRPLRTHGEARCGWRESNPHVRKDNRF